MNDTEHTNTQHLVPFAEGCYADLLWLNVSEWYLIQRKMSVNLINNFQN